MRIIASSNRTTAWSLPSLRRLCLLSVVLSLCCAHVVLAQNLYVTNFNAGTITRHPLADPQRYNTNGVWCFYNYQPGQIVTK